MNHALAAVVSQSQSKKVSTSSKARQYKSSAPRTWLEWTPSQKSLCVQLFLEGNYNHIVLRYGCQAPPLNTLRTWAGKMQEGEPLEGYGTNSVLNRREEETILKFIIELKYEAAVIDLDTIAALGRLVAERSRGPGLAPVLDRQWAANFRRRHKMGCLKKITTERLPSTVSDLALDNKWRREFLDLVEQPQKYGVRIPEGEPQSLPPWAQLGLDETPLQYAPKLCGGYAARENRSDTTAALTSDMLVVNRGGTVKVLQVLHRGRTRRCHARLDVPQGLPSYMHKDHAEKKCQTGDTFKRLMIKVDTEVAKDRRDHGVAQNYPCVVIMDWVGSHLDDDELKRVDDAEIRLANLYYFVARPHMYVFFGRARRSHVSNVGDQVINPGMRAWLRDRLKRRHIDHCLKIHDGLLPKHSKLNSSERTMKALLVTWLAEWVASPLTTTHILSSWNMVFTEVPVTESVDDVDLPCPSAAVPMPAPLLSVVPGNVSDSEEASEAQAEADLASGAEVEDNIDVLSVPGTPPVQRAAKRGAETRLDRLAKRFRAAPRDVHAQRVARENRQRAREAREAVQTSDDEGTLSCAVMLTMSEREQYLLFPLE